MPPTNDPCHVPGALHAVSVMHLSWRCMRVLPEEAWITHDPPAPIGHSLSPASGAEAARPGQPISGFPGLGRVGGSVGMRTGGVRGLMRGSVGLGTTGGWLGTRVGSSRWGASGKGSFVIATMVRQSIGIPSIQR